MSYISFKLKKTEGGRGRGRGMMKTEMGAPCKKFGNHSLKYSPHETDNPWPDKFQEVYEMTLHKT
jgi:hypothetical protein